jgi:hypothetical protein
MWADVAGRRVAGSGCLSVPGLAEHIKRGSAGPAGVERVWQGIRFARRALAYGVAAVAGGFHRLIGCRR